MASKEKSLEMVKKNPVQSQKEDIQEQLQVNPLSSSKALRDLRKSTHSLHSKRDSNMFGIELTDSPPEKISFFTKGNDHVKDKVNSFMSKAGQNVDKVQPKVTRNLF